MRHQENFYICFKQPVRSDGHLVISLGEVEIIVYEEGPEPLSRLGV